jgi:hypothetical protein
MAKSIVISHLCILKDMIGSSGCFTQMEVERIIPKEKLAKIAA